MFHTPHFLLFWTVGAFRLDHRVFLKCTPPPALMEFHNSTPETADARITYEN